jgi:cell division protein FtsZ
MSIKGARGVLINITGGNDLALHEVNEASTLVQEEADEDANIIFGAVLDPSMENRLRITVIATGFGDCGRASEPVRGRDDYDTGDRPGSRRADKVRSLPRDGRRVVRLGTIIDEDDNPRYVPSSDDRVAGAGDASEYDIPTFLRKQAD